MTCQCVSATPPVSTLSRRASTASRNSASLINQEEIIIREIPFRGEGFAEWVSLRQGVLRDPLELQYSEEDIAAESGHSHFGAFQDSVLLGGMILVRLDDYCFKVRQVAVSPDCQGMGIGKKLMIFAEREIIRRGGNLILLHARQNVMPFYEGLGYEVIGEPFLEVGIPHSKMEKRLQK